MMQKKMTMRFMAGLLAAVLMITSVIMPAMAAADGKSGEGKADDAANKCMQATSNDKRETYLATEKKYCEAALNYSRTDEQKSRANLGISICYFEETKLHGGNISESDAAKGL